MRRCTVEQVFLGADDPDNWKMSPADYQALDDEEQTQTDYKMYLINQGKDEN